MNTTELVPIKETDLELVVQSKQLGLFTTNALQIKAIVQNALPQYSIDNYNESNIESAKKDKAMLNKSAKALNDSRIQLEKEFMKPFDELKNAVNDTVKLISDCSNKIDSVIKESEQKAETEKKKEIKEIWDKKEYTLVPFEKIFDPKWLNKSFKMKDIRINMELSIAKIENDIKTLEAIGEDTETLKAIYLTDLNLSNAIQQSNILKQNREKVKVHEAATFNFPPAIKETIAKVPEVIPEEKPVEKVVETPTQQEVYRNSELLERTMKVWGTMEQIIALGNFMNENGIEFQKL